MSRPRSHRPHAHRLLMEALEDRRVMTGLALGASALIELNISGPASAHVAESDHAANVSVLVQPEDDDDETDAQSKAAAHDLVVDLRREHQEARHELKDEYKEARADLRHEEREWRDHSRGRDEDRDDDDDRREEEREGRVEFRFEFHTAVNNVLVQLKEEYHEQLDELREDFNDNLTEIISEATDHIPPRGNDHDNNNNNSGNGRPDGVGDETIQDVVRQVIDNLEPVAPIQEVATTAGEHQVVPGASDALVPQNDRIAEPSADQEVVPPPALPNNPQAPATAVHESPVARAAATGDGLRTSPAATASPELVVGAVGVAAEEQIAPVTLVIAGTQYEEEDAGLQGAGLAAGDSSFSTASLDAALQHILQGADQVARTLTQNSSFLPWMLAVLAGGVGLELHRRKKKAVRPVLAAASLTANSTLSWVPGMPGSFSDEDA